MYASLADLRVAGAEGSDAELTAALGAAKKRIDRFTGDTFEPVDTTVRALLSNGLAPLPMRVQSVSSVAYAGLAGGGSVLPATAYTVRSSATPGDIDAVELLGYGLLNAALLDVTYEPVRSQTLGQGEQAVLVTGTFGWDEVPDAVKDAAVQLALADLPGGGTGGTVNVEGDASLGVAPTVPLMNRSASSTGSSWADGLLRGYVRKRLLVS